MAAMALHDEFVGEGCVGREAPQPAVTVGAGAIWGHTYNKVTSEGGRYVQGGGCLTVGVAGLVQAGGFGSFSKISALLRPASWKPRSSPPTASSASPTIAPTPIFFGGSKVAEAAASASLPG